MKIVISHLRNSIAVALTVFVLAVASLGPLCAPACAATMKHSCCDEAGSHCAAPEHSVSKDAACGHSVTMVAERVEQPVVVAAVAFVPVPARLEFAQPVAVALNVPVQNADSSPPSWFDPLLVTLRL